MYASTLRARCSDRSETTHSPLAVHLKSKAACSRTRTSAATKTAIRKRALSNYNKSKNISLT